MKITLIDLCKKLDLAIHYFEVAFLSLGLGVMTCALFGQVVASFFDQALPWAGELARHLMLWVTCVGASAATRSRQHIAIEAFSNLAKGRLRRALEVFVGLTCVVLCATACVLAAEYVLETREFGRATVVLKIPLWMIYSALPVSAGFIGLRFGLALVLPPPPESERSESGVDS